MTKLLVNIFLFCLLIGCHAAQQPQPTVLTSPTIFATQGQNTLIPTISPLDGKAAYVTGMTVEEIESYYTKIITALENHSPEDLVSLLNFPFHFCGRCTGRVIETPEQFIDAYDEIVDPDGLKRVLESSLEDVIVKYSGVGLGQGAIWFSVLCDSSECGNRSIKIVKFFGQCEYYYDYLIENGYILPEPGVFTDDSTFQFGTYRVTSVESIGGSFLTEEQVASYQSVKITGGTVDASDAGGFVYTCDQPELEFCGPSVTKMTPIDVQPVGSIHILCNQIAYSYFDVLGPGELGMYYDGHYFFLELSP